MAGPLSPPFRVDSRVSSESPPLYFPLAWQLRQRAWKIGLIWASKSMRWASSIGLDEAVEHQRARVKIPSLGMDDRLGSETNV